MITFRSFIQRKSRPVVAALGSMLTFRNVVLPLLFGAIMVCTEVAHVHAGPKDGNVVAGDANIVQLNPKLLEIIQASDKVIIDWRSFSIDWDELVRFLQPDSDSIALNRVNGDTPSYILGQLTADGRVMLINPNGVLFGDSAVVDIGSLVATTIDIRNEDFMAGDYNFDVERASGGTVVNRGRITAAEGGIVALVAPGVENSGVIVARLGRVALASGNSFALDFYGDRLIQIGVDDSVAERLLAPDGTELKALVDNSGGIFADGGTVMLMAASAAKDVVDYAINMEGIIEARTATERNGQIVLEGAGEGIVRVTGTLDASGRESGETGGEVKILGSKVGLVGQAKVDVSGDAAGGEVLIGGNFQGRGPERNADFTTIGSEVAIQADALTTGDGGRVIVWSDRVTRFYGNISARGGRDSGDGGFAEISGKQHLQFAPNSIDLSAPKGLIGELLLDPLDIVISDGDGSDDSAVSGDNVIYFSDDSTATYNITPAAFEAIDADITLQALQDITVSSPIDRTGSGDSTLTLQAGRHLIINANITGSIGAHSFIFEADSPRSSNNDGVGTLTIASGVTITSSNSTSNNGDITFGHITLIGAEFDINATSSINAGGDIYVAPSQAVAMTISTTANLSLAEIGRFTTSGTIHIGTATTGPDGSGGDGSSISASGITVSEDLTISGSASLVLDSGGATTLSADVSTDDGNITFADAVTLGANVTVKSDADDDATDGNITFTSTVDGAQALTVNAGVGTVAFQGAVGATSPTSKLVSLTVDGYRIWLKSVSTTGEIMVTMPNIGYGIHLNGDYLSDDGNITFDGDLRLDGAVRVDSDANDDALDGEISLSFQVRGNGHALTVDASDGMVTLGTTLGHQTQLGSLTVVGGQIDIGNVHTINNIDITGTNIDLKLSNFKSDDGNITFNGPVDLHVDVTVDSDADGNGTGGNITFTSTVDGDGSRELTLDAGGGTVDLQGAVGGTTKLASLTVDGGQVNVDTVATTGDIDISGSTNIDLNGATYESDDGDITFTGAVDLHADVTVDSDADDDATDGDITFTSTVDGGYALTLDAGGGTVLFQGAVGGTNATSKLANLTVEAGEVALMSVSTTGEIKVTALSLGIGIQLNGDYFSDDGNITFTGNVDLGSAVRVDSDADGDATGGNIKIFDLVPSVVPGVVPGDYALTLDAGDGGVELDTSPVGGGRLESLTVTGGQIDIGDVATTGDIDITGTNINLYGSTYGSNDGNITFNGPVDLHVDVTVDSDADGNGTGGNITFTSTVDGGHALTVKAGGGAVAFQGAVGGTTKLASLTVTGGQVNVDTVATTGNIDIEGTDIDLNGASYQSEDGVIKFTGPVELHVDVTMDSDADDDGTDGNITFTSTVDGGHALTVDADGGEVDLQGAVGGTTKLASLTVDGGQVNVDTVATTGDIDIEGGTGIALNGATYASDDGDITLGGAGGVTISGSSDSTVSLQAGGNLTINTNITGSNGAHSLIFEADSPGLSSNDGNGKLTIASGVTITSNNGDITLIGAEFDIDTSSSINAGTGDIHVAPSRSVAMTISNATANLSDAEIGTFTTSGTIYIGTATTGRSGSGGAGSSISASSITVSEDLTISGSASLVLDSSGTTTLSADVSTDDGDITFKDAVTLGADVTVDSNADDDVTDGDITFTSTVDGSQMLTLNAATGNIYFGGDVGSADKLSAITVNNAHDVTVATTMWVGIFTQTAGTGTTDFGSDTIYVDTSVDVTTVNIRGKIVTQDAAILKAQEDIRATVEVDSLTIEASNAYLVGTVGGVRGRAFDNLITIINKGSGTYRINEPTDIAAGIGSRTYLELSSLPLPTVTHAAGVFTSFIPILRASVSDSIYSPYIVTDSEASSPLLTPEHGAEDYYEDIPLLLKTHDDEMVEME